jgi:branched-chain amino acid transport system permease protein
LQDWLPQIVGSGGNFETIAFGALLVLVLQLAPEGVWPHLVRAGFVPSPPKSAGPLPTRGLPDAGTPLLSIARLCKNFGGISAVDRVSFAVAAGEILGLIGPNGAGKSTIFDLLSGVRPPDAGEIRFAGHSLAGARARDVARFGIARSFQHVVLVPEMSVLENVAIGAHLRGQAGVLAALLRTDREEERRLLGEASRALASVALSEAAAQPAGTLALGQQRLVEIARALALDPVLLLLDEPAAGLRREEKQALAVLLARLRAQGVTIVLVEHDMSFVMGLADRLVVLDFGEKLAEGAPDTIRASPGVIEAYLGSVA